jgi:hypothetical protein
MSQYLTDAEVDALPIGALIRAYGHQYDSGRFMVVTHHEPGEMWGNTQLPNLIGVINLEDVSGSTEPVIHTTRSLIGAGSWRLRRIA